MGEIRIKDWGRFQHYKNRKPEWIKLYRDLLDDIEWHKLDAAAAKFLVGLWLLASENKGALPETDDIAFRLRIPESDVISRLSELSHWLVQDASAPLASGYQSACLDKEEDKEKEEEERGASAPSGIVFEGSYVKTVTEKNLTEWLGHYTSLIRSDMLAELALCDAFYAGQDSPSPPAACI